MAIFRFNSSEERKFYIENNNKGIFYTYLIKFDVFMFYDLFQDTNIDITLYKSKYNV